MTSQNSNNSYKMKDQIRHDGVIQSIEDNHVLVRIVQQSACTGCKAKDLCNSSESKVKTIDVFDPLATRFKVGEEVVVCSALTAGKLAVRLAFGIPLAIIVVWMLFAMMFLHLNELVSLSVLLVLLVIYFGTLNKFQHRFDKTLTFWIEK